MPSEVGRRVRPSLRPVCLLGARGEGRGVRPEWCQHSRAHHSTSDHHHYHHHHLKCVSFFKRPAQISPLFAQWVAQLQQPRPLAFCFFLVRARPRTREKDKCYGRAHKTVFLFNLSSAHRQRQRQSARETFHAHRRMNTQTMQEGTYTYKPCREIRVSPWQGRAGKEEYLSACSVSEKKK